MRTSWRRWGLIFLLAFAFRLLYLYTIQANPFFDSPVVDAQTYHEQALALVKAWTAAPSPTAGPPDEVFWQPPLYPYFLAGLYWLLGISFWKVRLVQAALGTLTCVLASELASRRIGARAGWLTGLLLAVYGPLLFYDGELLVPVLSLGLDTAALGVWLGASEAPGWRRVGLTGLLLGLSAVARPTVLLFAGGLGLVLLLERARPLTQRLARILVLGLSLLLPILPVTLHNWRAAETAGAPFSERLILISSNGGINFYLGNQADYASTVGIRPGISWKALMREPARAGVYGDAAESRYWRNRGLEFLIHQPGEALRLYGQKIWLLLQAHELYRNLDYRFFAGLYAPWLLYLPSFGLLLPLALLGLWQTRREKGHRTLWLYLGTQALGIVMFFVVARYRLSLVPVLAIYAGAGLETAWERLRAALASFKHTSEDILEQTSTDTSLKPVFRTFKLMPLFLTGLLGASFHLDPYRVAAVDASEGYNLMGQAHSNAERRPQALAAFQEALHLNPENIDAVFNAGRELHLLGRCEEAIGYYSLALQHYPEDRDALNNQALCSLATGHRAEGIALLKRLVSLYPQSPDVLFNLAQAQEQDFALADALETLQKARTLSPHEPLLKSLEATLTRRLKRLNRVDALLAQKDARIAQARASRAHLTEPAAVQALDARLVALNNLGHNRLKGSIPSSDAGAGEEMSAEAALDPFLDALDLDASYATVWSNLGQSLFLMGRFERAVQAFEVALALKPDFHGARLGLAIVYIRMGHHPRQARSTLEQLVRETDGGLQQRARDLLEELPR